MKQKLPGGAELDLLTVDEVRELLADFAPAQPVPVRESSNGKTDGVNGLALIDLYRVPVAMEFRLHRLRVKPDSKTPAAAYTNAGGFMELLVNERTVEDIPLTGTPAGVAQLPFTLKDGFQQGAIARNGELVQLRLTCPTLTNENVTVYLQGTLLPLGSPPPE